MSIFQKVTLQSLKKNKTRTVVTVIGIVLSAAMICAVTTFVSSIYNYALENAIYVDGDWHGSALDAKWRTYEDIWNTGEVSNAVYAQQVGYAIAEGCQNEYKPYLFVLGVSEDFRETMPVHITSGEYPADSNEILLPDHLAHNGGVQYELGDTLTLELGDRMSEGYALGQNNPYLHEEESVGEELAVRETREYTVVGFYERPSFEEYSAPGYTAITIRDKETYYPYLYNVWFKMEKAKDVYTFMEENQLSGNTNSSVLTYSGVSRLDGFDTMITALAAIVIGLIMFGSVSLIYNAFAISVSERTKQFGLLSSVGATKKQLRRMVFFEALVVSVIGIPLGILAGVGGIGVTLMIIGHKFQAWIGYPIPLRVSVSPISIVIAAVIALVTVLISAWIPSKRATRITAVEAIRQNQDISVKGKTVKTSKLVYKLFGLPGMLANKHYKRNRKKYRATIISLFMSIVLFVSASAFTDYLMESVTGGFASYGYDLRFMCKEEDLQQAGISRDELLEKLGTSKSVTDAAYTQSRYLGGKVQGEEVSTIITFVNDSKFEELLKEYELDEEAFMNPDNPLAVAVDGFAAYDPNEEKYVKKNILESDNSRLAFSVEKEFEGYIYHGQVHQEDGTLVNQYLNQETEEIMTLPMEEAYEDIALETGKIIYEAPYFVDDSYGLILIYPTSLAEAVIPCVDIANYSYRYLFQSDNHSESYTAMEEILSENGFDYGNLTDYAERVEEDRSIITIIQVFSYGFIVLISLIAAANVFNTISTNISLRRREFAMLKSVGMTSKGFNRMMNFECLLYGSRALLYGLPVSIGITYLIYLAVTAGYMTEFRLPWTAIGIAVLSVFAVVFATMVYSMRKIKKDNPIDALKNENL
ncbi:MAG: ABC transporter permease [Tyzzerella sp.]|nr:ABC transporter permease [Tyzzerella sp.]